MKNLTYYNTNKITALRQFNGTHWLVAQGPDWNTNGLSNLKVYKEFSDYSDAIDYFNQIK